MAVDVIMPQMGESIFEGTITKWLKSRATRSIATNRFLKFQPIRWTRKSPRPPRVF